MEHFRNGCKARAVVDGYSSEVLETLLEVGPRTVDLGGHPGGGVLDWDAAGERVHEGFGEASEVYLLQAPEKRGEVEGASAGHLQQFFFAGLLPAGSGSVLLSVEKDHLVSESGNKVALQFGILGKMMRSEGEGETRVGGQFGKPLDAVRGRQDLSAVVLDCDGDAMFCSGIGMGFHPLDEFPDLSPEIRPCCASVAACTADYYLAAEAPGDG